MDSIRMPSTIGNLEACRYNIDYATTLFIPGDKPKKIDWDYLNILN